MLKLIYMFRKRRDLTDAEFQDYWENVHAPIAVQIPGLRRLVQLRVITDDRSSAPRSVDGITELWFDGIEGLRSAQTCAAWALAFLDEANFIEAASTTQLVSEERAVFQVLDAIDSTDWPEDQERPLRRPATWRSPPITRSR